MRMSQAKIAARVTKKPLPLTIFGFFSLHIMLQMLRALCNSTVQHNRSFIQTSFCRLSVYSWEGRRALSYTKSYILINFMVHLHYYQSPIQISSRDSIVHGRMFHYLICISIDLRGTICTSICQSRARNTTPDYETHKRKLQRHGPRD